MSQWIDLLWDAVKRYEKGIIDLDTLASVIGIVASNLGISECTSIEQNPRLAVRCYHVVATRLYDSNKLITLDLERLVNEVAAALENSGEDEEQPATSTN